MRGATFLSLAVLIAFFILIVFSSCNDGDDSSTYRGEPLDEDDEDSTPEGSGQDDDDDVAGPDDDDDDTNNNDEFNVVEEEDLGRTWKCAGHPGDCTEDYLDFLELDSVQPYIDPISEEELEQQLEDIEEGRVEIIYDTLSDDQIRDAVVQIGLRNQFMRDGIHERLLKVTTIRKDETSEYKERELLFEDPFVGVFQGILLMPKAEGPHPGIVAIHGHSDTAEIYRDNYYGKEYPASGYAILMLTMRAMSCGEPEDLVTRSMLLHGFTFMGLRSYESLLALKYLLYLGDVDRIGLIGHSGGSVTNNLTVWLQGIEFEAAVTDETSTYNQTIPDDLLLDCTVPGLYPYSFHINNAPPPVPVLEVLYGYPDGIGEIIEFFDEWLRN